MTILWDVEFAERITITTFKECTWMSSVIDLDDSSQGDLK